VSIHWVVAVRFGLGFIRVCSHHIGRWCWTLTVWCVHLWLYQMIFRWMWSDCNINLCTHTFNGHFLRKSGSASCQKWKRSVLNSVVPDVCILSDRPELFIFSLTPSHRIFVCLTAFASIIIWRLLQSMSSLYSPRDVTESAKIWICQIRIVYYESIGFGFGFVTQSQLVQFSQVKNAKLWLEFKDVY